MKIPKLIHHLAPADTSLWHPIWKKCKESWGDHFPDYEQILWSDDVVDKFIETHFSKYYSAYKQFPLHIMQLDFARLCIMHFHGGIYADMDMFCYKNFIDLIKKDCYIVGNIHGLDIVENSLLIGNSKHFFWERCIESIIERFYNLSNNNREYIELAKLAVENQDISKYKPFIVFYVSGTHMLSDVYRQHKDVVEVLQAWQFNNIPNAYDKNFITKHLHTNLWGKDEIKLKDKNKYNDFLIETYKLIREIDLTNFDFYNDYTNGNYLKEEIDYKNVEIDLPKHLGNYN